MSDPICGPLIHNFVDQTYEDKVNYENSVYFKNFENGGKGGKFLEKKNIFSRRKGRKRRKIIGEVIILCGGEEEQKSKRRGKYLEKENIFFAERNKNGEYLLKLPNES